MEEGVVARSRWGRQNPRRKQGESNELEKEP